MKSLLALAAVLLAASCTPQPRSDLGGARVLIYSGTTGYRHSSIEGAVSALAGLIREAGGEPHQSGDPAAFDPSRLARFRAIVLLSSTTDPARPESEWLTGSRRAALQAFVRRGGGIVAIHAAADSHYSWPWYARMLGGRFERHPPGTPRGHLTVVDRTHSATVALPATVERVDEWYQIAGYDPSSRLLVTLDPASIGETGAPRPISWAREFEGGRIFYTALGHTPEAYSDSLFLAHLRGALTWVLTRD